MSHGEGLKRIVTAQVCDVSKPLLSVHRMVQAGHTCVFAPGGSYIEDGQTSERMWLHEAGGMFHVRMWIPKRPEAAGF